MGKKLAIGVVIALASIGAIVTATAGFEWWQSRGNTASPVVVAPAKSGGSDADADERPAPTALVGLRPTELPPGAAPIDILAAPESSPEAAAITLHPQVQAQAMERVAVIVESHSDAWPWVAAALDVAQMRFFEDLHPECDSAAGCYNHSTGDTWLTLDALREPDSGSLSFFIDRRRPSDIVLHELAHAYTRSFPPGSQLLDMFGQHYAGCRGRGLDTDRLAAELLADTMAMVITTAGSSLPKNYGYFDSGGFAGCLAESSQPDAELVAAVYTTLFNCESTHALDTLANHQDPRHHSVVRILGSSSPWFGNDADADAVLLTCYGIDCTTPNNGCENMTETAEPPAAEPPAAEPPAAEPTTFTAISAGGYHSCAIAVDGRAVCWGENRFNEADAPDGAYTAISAGSFHSCAIRADSAIVCWGANDSGQADAPDGAYTAISAGSTHSCAITADSRAVCWGANDSGQTDAPDGA